ncbi:MAG: energy-coupled thiamine transporter ThiT [Firmicutes bacterium]|nr:energy-coupled thiamine transporter ThiT [Bacillota bacterium]
MSKINVKDLCYMALYVALAVVLDYVSALIPFLQMPNGGSINLAVIPVFVASYHLGAKKGVAVGLLWWLVGFMMGFNNWYLNPMHYLLDYIIPVGVIGFACLLPKIGSINNVFTGVVVISIIRFVATVLSGVYYWPPEEAVAGSSAAWAYSLGYNFWYNFATMIVACILVPLIVNRLQKTKVKFIGFKG